jgi:hypothetical protein
MGYGRSGSTVLAMAIAAGHNGFSPVELSQLVPAIDAGHYCSCGEVASQCPFWTKVLNRWEALQPGLDLPRYGRLQERYERLTALPRLLAARKRPDIDLEYYASSTQALIRALHEVTGVSYIVDASKSPTRALLLAGIPEIDLTIVHLVRDCRAVAWSLSKEAKADPRSGVEREFRSVNIGRTVAAWSAHNLAGTVVATASRAKHVVVRYGDFVLNPEESLRAVAAVSGVEMAEAIQCVSSGNPISGAHVIAGNRLRMSGPQVIRPDFEWQSKLPVWKQLAIGMVTSPIAWLCGYSVWGSRGKTSGEASAH